MRASGRTAVWAAAVFGLSTAIVGRAQSSEKQLAVGDARWSEALERRRTPLACGVAPDAVDPGCFTLKIVVANRSSRDLSCTAVLAFKPRAANSADDAEGAAVIPPGQSADLILVSRVDPPRVSAFRSQCEVFVSDDRKPDVPEGCELERETKPVLVYPAASLRNEETGAVVLDLSASADFSAPGDLRIARTSGFPNLDAAAFRAAHAVRYRTNCPGQHFRFATQFRIPE